MKVGGSKNEFDVGNYFGIFSLKLHIIAAKPRSVNTGSSLTSQPSNILNYAGNPKFYQNFEKS